MEQSAPGRSCRRRAGSRRRPWPARGADDAGGPGPGGRGVGDVGGVGDGLLSLVGGVEHLLGERALLGDQVLSEVEYGVEDLLRVARSLTRRAGPAAHALQQFVAALAPLLPQTLEVLLACVPQLGERLVRGLWC